MTFYVYDPGEGRDTCLTEFTTLEAAIANASSLIEAYREFCEPEWPEYVHGIEVLEASGGDPIEDGIVVARAVECNRIERPDDVDEDGYSPSEDLWFNSVDYYVDYRIEATPPPRNANNTESTSDE